MLDTTTRKNLINFIRQQFKLDWRGIHGPSHWGRVETRGLTLCEQTGADSTVLTLFSLFHDSCRLTDYSDPLHGARGAALAQSLRGVLFEATDVQMNLLTQACNDHSTGLTFADITVQVCWDADRLDLVRVGTRPLPQYLCTEAAKQMIPYL